MSTETETVSCSLIFVCKNCNCLLEEKATGHVSKVNFVLAIHKQACEQTLFFHVEKHIVQEEQYLQQMLNILCRYMHLHMKCSILKRSKASEDTRD